MVRQKDSIYTRKKYLFLILYSIEICGLIVSMAVLGAMMSSFDDVTDYMYALVFFILFLSALSITAYIQELIAHHKPFDVIYYSLIILGGWLSFLTFYLLCDIFMFTTVIYSAATMCLIFYRYAFYLRKSGDFESLEYGHPDMKTVLIPCILLLCVMMQMLYVNFVSQIFIAWSFIPAAIICAIVFTIAYFMFRKKLKAWISTKARKVWVCIEIAIIVFFGAFAYTFTTVGVANYVFDYGAPTPIECTVLDKKVRSGSRSGTHYEIKVKLKGEIEWIEVSSHEYYYEIAKGETITVNYYSGALGIEYYLYEE